MIDTVKVEDRLRLATVQDGAQIDERAFRDSPIYADGFVSLVCRERGKLVPNTRRVGHNIWTLTGREHLAQLMSYSSYGPPVVATRTDRMRYIGFGTGSQPEVSSVTRLNTAIAYDGSGGYLAQLSLPTYPLSPTRTSVRYSRTFSEIELSVLGTVVLTEAGLFTDGDPGSAYVPGTRDLLLVDNLLQAPNAYKVFEPLTKTQNFVLEVSWEVRF